MALRRMCWFLTALLAGSFAGSMAISSANAAAPTTAPTADTEIDLVPTVDLVPTSYRHRLVQQLSLADDNQQTWLKAITDIKPEHREALAYLLINMPEADLKSLKGDKLVANVELAYQAREQTAWGKAVPQEIFFRDVLPYANVDETRENWRQDYYDRFMPLVKDAKSTTEAVQILNKKVFKIVNVKYHATKREKPNQSPYESAKIGYASCTGLSIILSDACRAVGVPARLAGTPLWTDEQGNHTWTEVWDKQWYFTGSAEPAKKLNDAWFAEKAAKANASRPENRIYAVSFEHTSLAFPMVWSDTQKDVYGIDVTSYYKSRQPVEVVTPTSDTQIEIRQNGILVAAGTGKTTFELGAGNYTQTLLDASGKVIETKPLTLKAPTTAPVAN